MFRGPQNTQSKLRMNIKILILFVIMMTIQSLKCEKNKINCDTVKCMEVISCNSGEHLVTKDEKKNICCDYCEKDPPCKF